MVAVTDGGWSEWSSCSGGCGRGLRRRSCTRPAPGGGGANCVGNNTRNCWSEECSTTTSTTSSSEVVETTPQPAERKCYQKKYSSSLLVRLFDWWSGEEEQACEAGVAECCSSEPGCECGEGGGHCRTDAECEGGLVCGHSNCGEFHPGAEEGEDCCTKPGNQSRVTLPNSRHCLAQLTVAGPGH